jgi:cell division transport system permease protein
MRFYLKTFFLHHCQAFKTSLTHLSSSLLSTLTTFVVIGFALALPLGLYVLLQNIQTFTTHLHTTNQISLYLKKGGPAYQIEDLLNTLKKDPDLAAIQYISPEEGIKEFQTKMQFGDLLEHLKENPLPGVVVIQPQLSLQTEAQMNQLVERLKQLPFVDDIQLDKIWLQRLNAIIALGQKITGVLMLFFSFTIILIIGNTLRLMTERYREEIMIIKLLGGTSAFTRRPFVYSGILYGLMGSILAWLLIDLFMAWLQTPLKNLMDLYDSSFLLKGLNLRTTFWLLFSGSALGYFAARLTVSHQIRKIEDIA